LSPVRRGGTLLDMIVNSLLKKPILIIGILLMVIFIFDLRRRGIFFGRYQKLKATSCNSVLVMLNRRTPDTWKNSCKESTLTVAIQLTLPPKIKNAKDQVLRQYLYRELANNLIKIAKNSLNESLERTFSVHVKQRSQRMDIDAVTEGRFIAKLATISDPKFIAEHLKNTVHIKERPK
jgi:hypothetical protein